MKKVLFLLFFAGVTLTGWSETYYTTGPGNFNDDPIWSTNPDDTTGVLWSTITLAAGDTIYIADDITIDAPNTIGVDVVIIFDAIVTLEQKVTLTTNSRIDFTTNGQLIAQGNPESPKIAFGTGPAQWTAGDGNLSGPGYLDVNSNGALPIEVVYFNASVNGFSVNLDWATASEENFDRFEVQRAVGSFEFTTIGTIYGAAENSYELRDYQFIDERPVKGINYYRLKAIDLDGTFEISDLQAVKVENADWVKVYPNPASDRIVNLDIANPAGQMVKIFDSYGRNVSSSSVSGYTQQIDLSSLAPGVYTIEIIDGLSRQSRQLIVD